MIFLSEHRDLCMLALANDPKNGTDPETRVDKPCSRRLTRRFWKPKMASNEYLNWKPYGFTDEDAMIINPDWAKSLCRPRFPVSTSIDASRQLAGRTSNVMDMVILVMVNGDICSYYFIQVVNKSNCGRSRKNKMKKKYI